MPTRLIQHASHAPGSACLQVLGRAAALLSQRSPIEIAILQPGTVDRFLDPRNVAAPWTSSACWFRPVSATFESGQLNVELDYAVTYHLRANQPYRLLLRAAGTGEVEERFTGVGNLRRPSAPPSGWAAPEEPSALPPQGAGAAETGAMARTASTPEPVSRAQAPAVLASASPSTASPLIAPLTPPPIMVDASPVTTPPTPEPEPEVPTPPTPSAAPSPTPPPLEIPAAPQAAPVATGAAAATTAAAAPAAATGGKGVTWWPIAMGLLAAAIGIGGYLLGKSGQGSPARAGAVFKDCADCPEMVAIPAGRFRMGAAPGEQTESGKAAGDSLSRSRPQHDVQIAGFAAGKFEVTLAQYRAFVTATGYRSASGCFVPATGGSFDRNPAKSWRDPGYAQEDTHPVACVGWEDAKAYARWLGKRTGKPYRLLTEAEWEYAARAGASTPRPWGEDEGEACAHANLADLVGKALAPLFFSGRLVAGCSDRHAHTAPVGSYRANRFGLHDMLGNVWEWTEDCWNESYSGAPTDGSAWSTGDCSRRMIRGSGWASPPRDLHPALRGKLETADRVSSAIGFRVAHGD